MKISLCAICFNEEALIERFLDSFAPAFDELSLCRAVGSLPPDLTVARAEAWCTANGKAFVFTEHVNGPGAQDWPHTDDFAEARNQSFAAATGDWLFWADCDDLCHEPEALRDVLAAPGCGDLVRFIYDVIGTNKQPLRERAIRRTLFAAGNRWRFPVHENLLVPPNTVITDAGAPVWIHQPKFSGKENRVRNRTILSRALAGTAANYFYVHQEWFCEGNKANADRFGRLALAFPDLDPSFRYEVNLNLARITADNEQALRYAQDAHAVFPWCREACAMLALIFMERADPARALHWAERLDRTPLPAENLRPWTHEPKWYGWAAIDLLARCQRFADQPEAAKRTQARHGPPLFSLLHASRGRAATASDCRNTWLNLAQYPDRVQHILCCDADDRATVRLAKQFEHTISHAQSCVAAWNLGAEQATGKILIQLSDDWAPVPGWDAKILAEIEAAGKAPDDEWVLAISDGHRTDDLLCMAICSRARYLAQADADTGRPSLFFPGYESVYSDNEFSHRAWRDGVVIDARSRLAFHHLHPAFGAGRMDETYEHTNQPARYARGKALFEARNPDAIAK